jgi:hypothetical protein
MWWKYELMYENGKIRHAETIPGMGAGVKRMMEEVNSTTIYCKSFGKCHDVLQYNNNKNK